MNRLTALSLTLLVLAAPMRAEDSPPASKSQTAARKLEAVYQKGFDYLVAQQDPASGAWKDPGGQPDVATTALVVAVLARAPSPLHDTHLEQIKSGVAYILKNQQTDGSFVDPEKQPRMPNYKTSLAVMALCAVDKGKHSEAIAKGRAYLEGTQYNDGTNRDGGWGYDEKKGAPRADLSNSSMTIEALRAAGVPEDSEVFRRAVQFLQRVQNRSESNDQATAGDDGGFFYAPEESKAGTQPGPGGKTVYKSYGSMTYAGLMSMLHAYVRKDDPRVQGAVGWIQAHWTLSENPGLRNDQPASGQQGLYYYYHTFAKALAAYGEKTITTSDGTPHAWANELVDALAERQRPDGSWVNDADRWWEGFPPIVTSFALEALGHARGHVRE
ncbi:MAG: terpene cyclase/mutase family protein [Planctomycetes bacterium]|nr:terpene cyclase/mutase family protein [Planctomycetota bacterium]